jgi:hypothetical protein
MNLNSRLKNGSMRTMKNDIAAYFAGIAYWIFDNGFPKNDEF